MTPHLLIFLVAIAYLSWLLYRYFKGRKNTDAPFIEVIDDKRPEPPTAPRQRPKQAADDDSEWRRRVRDEIEEMTK